MLRIAHGAGVPLEHYVSAIEELVLIEALGFDGRRQPAGPLHLGRLSRVAAARPTGRRASRLHRLDDFEGLIVLLLVSHMLAAPESSLLFFSSTLG